MSPDHYHSSNMGWQKSKSFTDNAIILRRNSSQNEYDKNVKRSSILSTVSNSSSDHSNIFSTPRRSSKNFLDKIKYFEGKTDSAQIEENHSVRVKPVRKLSLKKVIDDVRAQFPEELNAISSKRNSKEYNSPRLPNNKNNHLQPNVVIQQNIEEPVTKLAVNNTENIKEISEKKLLVKKTINEAREEFAKEDLDVKNSDVDIINLNSKCAQFFSTSNSDLLLKGMTFERQFKTILKGSLSDNSFYPFEVASQMRYYIHDFFDYDLSPFEYD